MVDTPGECCEALMQLHTSQNTLGKSWAFGARVFLPGPKEGAPFIEFGPATMPCNTQAAHCWIVETAT
eukprot:6936745-Prorocentrum_lima.AAC.1